MERVGYPFVNNNGVLVLPPGFRFHPTDEELLLQYLRRKLINYPLPADVIREAEVCKLDPWNLPGDVKEDRYFFSLKVAKYPNGNRSNRATASGYWKATGPDKQIASVRFRKIIGAKKTLVFYQGKPPKGRKTDWVMHEYRLAIPPQYEALLRNIWVVSRIFLKKRNNRRIEEDEEEVEEEEEEEAADGVVVPAANGNAPVFYDFLAMARARAAAAANLNRAPAANSVSGSSGVTEVSVKVEAEDDEYAESSSTGNSLSFSIKPKRSV